MSCHLNNKYLFIIKLNSYVILKFFSCIDFETKKSSGAYSPFNISAVDIWSSIHSQEYQISYLGILFGDPRGSN